MYYALNSKEAFKEKANNEFMDNNNKVEVNLAKLFMSVITSITDIEKLNSLFLDFDITEREKISKLY